jgi:hypothetical protein
VAETTPNSAVCTRIETLSSLLRQAYFIYNRSYTTLFPLPRKHQVRVPGSFGAPVLPLGSQSKSWSLGLRKSRRKVQIERCDGLPPVPQFPVILRTIVREASVEHSYGPFPRYLCDIHDQPPRLGRRSTQTHP